MIFGKNNIRDFPSFGSMKYQGYWEGNLYLEAFSEDVEVIVRAKREGISEHQVLAMSKFLQNLQLIKENASQYLIELYHESSFEKSFDIRDIWHDLKPNQIEVTDESYDVITKKISILLIFSSKYCVAFYPAIEVIDGQFYQVLSGT